MVGLRTVATSRRRRPTVQQLSRELGALLEAELAMRREMSSASLASPPAA